MVRSKPDGQNWSELFWELLESNSFWGGSKLPTLTDEGNSNKMSLKTQLLMKEKEFKQAQNLKNLRNDEDLSHLTSNLTPVSILNTPRDPERNM